MTECTQSSFSFAALYRREVVAEFDGGDITTDAGGLLLREVDRRLRLTQRLAACSPITAGQIWWNTPCRN